MDSDEPSTFLIESVLRANGDRVEVRRVVFQSGTGTGWHRHSGWQAGFLTTGTLTHTTPQQTTQIQPGDVLVEEPHIVHEARNLAADVAELLYVAFVPAGAELSTPSEGPAESA